MNCLNGSLFSREGLFPSTGKVKISRPVNLFRVCHSPETSGGDQTPLAGGLEEGEPLVEQRDHQGDAGLHGFQKDEGSCQTKEFIR